MRDAGFEDIAPNQPLEQQRDPVVTIGLQRRARREELPRSTAWLIGTGTGSVLLALCSSTHRATGVVLVEAGAASGVRVPASARIGVSEHAVVPTDQTLPKKRLVRQRKPTKAF
jgi:hypothetical protein